MNSKFLPNTISTMCKRCKHWNSVEQQYWQRSEIPTMHFQRSLPRLPIPKLEQTCDRYLAAQRPILEENIFNRVRKDVMLFQETEGKELQERLISKDKKNTNTSYISEPWFDMYLRDRKPLPINYNPVLVLKNDEKVEYNKQLLKTTNLIISSLRFYKSLKENILEPEVFHLQPKKTDTAIFKKICSKVPSYFSWYAAYMFNAYPLDMSQYNNLFNSTRIPEIGKDLIYSKPGERHVVVQHNGYFYSFDVLDDNGCIISPETIMGNVKLILDNPRPPNEFPIGILTTLDRDEWANLRHRFISLGNEKLVNLIDSSLFIICLDNSVIADSPVTLCRNFIHGDGKDRWFDKSISMIVSKDGVAGINFEHSWGDGVAVLRYFQDIYKDSQSNPRVHPDSKPRIEEDYVHKHEIIVDDAIKDAVKKAINQYNKTCNSLDFNVLQSENIGKKLCKKYNLSPDAIMQLGFQVAYYKVTGKFVAGYESCSTAAFKHGRTETIRPCTLSTKAYSEAINSKQPPSNAELRHLLAECSKTHGKLTKEAAMGQGFDRHLFALRLTANDKNIPAIFQAPEFAALNHNIISTSTLGSPALWAGGFGPVVKDGLGIGYSTTDNDIAVLVTSYPAYCNGKDFTQALEMAYKEILTILQVKN